MQLQKGWELAEDEDDFSRWMVMENVGNVKDSKDGQTREFHSLYSVLDHKVQ